MATRSAILYQGEDMSPAVDYTDLVIWEESEFGTRAWRGEGSESSIVIRDPVGEQGSGQDLPSGLVAKSLASKNLFIVDLDGEYMFRGRVGVKNYGRDDQRVERYRQVECSLHDTNWDLDHIFVHGYARPAETDNQRIQGIIASYLSGSPRPTTHLNGSNYLSGSNTVNLAAETYNRTTPLEMIRSISVTANKQFFVTGDTIGGGSLFWDGNDSTVHAAGLRISDRPNEVTTTVSSEPAGTVRLYPSSVDVTDGSDPAAIAAPDLAAADKDAAWTTTSGDINEYNMMYETPVASTSSASRAWSGVNVSARYVCIAGFVKRLEGDLLSIVQGGGVVRGQHRSNSRFGTGISEVAQDDYSDFCVRVYRPGTGFVQTLAAVGAATGTAKFAAQTPPDNRMFGPYTFAAYAGALDGDYLVIDVGNKHVGPISGGAGAGSYWTDAAGSDLPISNSGVDNLNSWWQIGPAAESLPTYPPIWDVGPASTEDGSEQLSEVVLFYGSGGDQYVIAENDTVANLYAHASQVFTDDSDIDAATALTRARAILAHRQYEDKTYNVSIGPLTDDEVLLVKHGQTIQIKARAIPDADDQYRTMRIVQCRYTTPVPGTWFAHMQLGRPWKMEPYATGPVLTPTSGSVGDTDPGTVGAVGDQGTDNGEFANADHGHGHGNIVSGGPYHMAEDITAADAGGYFTSGHVEGQLQELGASGASGTDLGWFSVTDAAYGAVGDGVTNDTAAINLAIAAYNAAGGGVLYFPAGHYQTTGGLTSITAGGLILGDGHAHRDGTTQAVSLIDCSSTTASLFTIASHAVTMRGLALVQDGSTPSAGAGITVTSGGHARYENLSVSGFFVDIDIQDGEHWAMSGCYLYNSVSHGLKIAHTDLPDGGDWSLSDMWVTAAARTAASANAIQIISGGGGKIVNVKINADSTTRYTNGIALDIPTGVSTVDLLVSNCSLENVSQHAISATTTGSGTFRHINIVGNQTGFWSGTNNTGKGVSIVGAGTDDFQDIVISSNNFYGGSGTNRSAIQLTNVNNATLVGNELSGAFTSLYSSTTSSNITEVGGGVTDHGALTGLADDDHTHYLNEARHDALAHSGVGGEILISDTPSTPLVFADLLQNEAQDDLLYEG